MVVTTTAAIKQGDTFIFEQVFQQYHEKLYFYVFYRTYSSYLAEETTQLTFIKLWKYRNSLNEELDISDHLFRITKTTLIDLLRKEKNIDRLRNQVSSTGTRISESIAATIETEELRTSIYGAIRQMPLARRKVFEMSRLKGMSYKEIAAELSISVKTVENHIALALKQLRHFLGGLFIFILSLIK